MVSNLGIGGKNIPLLKMMVDFYFRQLLQSSTSIRNACFRLIINYKLQLKRISSYWQRPVVNYWLVSVPHPLAPPQASEAGTCLPIDQNAKDQLFASVSIPGITMCSVFSCFPLNEREKQDDRWGLDGFLIGVTFCDFFLWRTLLIGTFQFVFHFTGTF